MVKLPYEEGFHENKISTKSKPVKMNKETLVFYRKDIKPIKNKRC